MKLFQDMYLKNGECDGNPDFYFQERFIVQQPGFALLCTFKWRKPEDGVNCKRQVEYTFLIGIVNFKESDCCLLLLSSLAISSDSNADKAMAAHVAPETNYSRLIFKGGSLSVNLSTG